MHSGQHMENKCKKEVWPIQRNFYVSNFLGQARIVPELII